MNELYPSHSVPQQNPIDILLFDDNSRSCGGIMGAKVCNKCRVEKPATDDYFPTMPSGKLRPSCRVCMNERKGFKRCKKCGEEKLANRDNFGSMPSGGFRGSCRVCMRKNTAKHNKQNPEMQKKRSKIRKVSDGGFIVTDQLRRSLWQRDSGYCLLCNRPLGNMSSAQVDHLIPISRGGTNSPENLCLAHVQCNKEKHKKTYQEHREWRKRNNLD
jgi:hypothetical protein